MPPNSEIEIMPDLAALAQDYIERKAILDQAEELVDETKQKVMDRLGDVQAALIPIGPKLKPIYWRPQGGKPLYGPAIKDMSAQYQVMREKLIQIEATVKEGGEIDPNGVIKRLVSGADLIPIPASFIKNGKPSRPLMMQYILDRDKKDDE